MKKAVLSLALIAAAMWCGATSIIIYVTPDFAIMAADSKGFFYNAGTTKQENSTVSKIYKTAGVYFALAGVIKNEARNLDISQLVHKHLEESKDLERTLTNLKVDIRNRLMQYVSYNKQNSPKLYEANKKLGRYITSVGLITMKNNKPYAHIIGFQVVEGKNLRIEIDEDFAPAAGDTQDRLFMLGKNKAIHAYLDTMKKIDADPFVFVDKLMSVQIENTPQYVGKPVDMVKITYKETIWYRRKKSTPVMLP